MINPVSTKLTKLKVKSRIQNIENDIIIKENVFWATRRYQSKLMKIIASHKLD